MKKKSPHALRHSLEERRQYLKQQLSCRSRRVGEVVGGTTAEVAAVCFCFPCSLVDFAVLTMYKVPKGLCKKAMRSKRRERRLMMQRSRSSCSDLSMEDDLSMHPAVVAAEERFSRPEVDKDVLALENEMWEKFSESGFWRSPPEDGMKMNENLSSANIPDDTKSSRD